MRQLVGALGAFVLMSGIAAGQPAAAPTYVQGENPFQGDYEFAVGRPVNIFAEVQGLAIDAVLVTALEELRPGADIRCEVQLTGTNGSDRKVAIAPVLLLEDASGKGLERVTLEPFKVKSGRPYDRRQKLSIPGDALSGATRVYVLIQLTM